MICVIEFSDLDQIMMHGVTQYQIESLREADFQFQKFSVDEEKTELRKFRS